MILHFYSDPGHGWLKVPRKLLGDWGIADQVSTYSYQKNDWVYLEEDRGMQLFLNSAKERDIQVTFKDHTANKSSQIRHFDYYTNKETRNG